MIFFPSNDLSFFHTARGNEGDDEHDIFSISCQPHLSPQPIPRQDGFPMVPGPAEEEALQHAGGSDLSNLVMENLKENLQSCQQF